MPATEIVAVDIGGTHARFALATIHDGRVTALGDDVTLKATEHASLQTAWQTYAAGLGRPLPRAAGIAIACPVNGDVLKLTNNPWIIRPALIRDELGLDSFKMVNDFAAVAHAVAQAGPAGFCHLAGPDRPLPISGPITVLGPGTGLGVAQLLLADDRHHVIATEAGHIDFAPLDSLEDAILAQLRRRYARVSVERIVSGPGLANLHAGLAAIAGRAIDARDDRTLWAAALAGADSLAAAALDRFCRSFGAVAGDLALAQGASGVVLAGSLATRLAAHLPRSGFHQRFVAKGRFEGLMASLPIKLMIHPQPGLFGAAAAYAETYR
jgi:glucokinase